MSDTFLECWANPRQTMDDLIVEALAGFEARFAMRPERILISPSGMPEGVTHDTYRGIPITGADRLRCRDTRWRVAVGPVPVPQAARLYAQEGLPL
jgi:hypothetical protein